MERQRVKSESIAEIGYDATAEILEVLFANGRLYHYFSVSQDAFERLMRAESHGKHLNANIKSRHQYKQIR